MALVLSFLRDMKKLGELSRKTQVVFFTHHAHLLPLVQQVFADGVNIVRL